MSRVNATLRPRYLRAVPGAEVAPGLQGREIMQKITGKLVELERDLGGTLGVYAVPLTSASPDVKFNETERFPAASTIKVFVLQSLLEQVDGGNASLDEELSLAAGEQVTGSGVLKALTAGRFFSIRDLATLMIIISDNTATNLLIERLGVDAVNSTCARQGWHQTHLAGKLQKGLTSASYTCPRDLGDYFARLWRGELLPERLTAVAQEIFRQQQLTDQLGREIGYDGYSTETGASSLVIASKSGSIRGVRNDAGVITSRDSAYAVAIMTKGCADERFYPENLGSQVVRRVSKLMFDRYLPSPVGQSSA